MASTKRKAAEDTTKPITFTTRNPPWTYLKLQLVHQPNTSQTTKSNPLDSLTARTYLTSALSQFLGLSGTAVPIDILSLSQPDFQSQPSQPTDKYIWIRVPRQDAASVVAAVSSWIGGMDMADSGGSVALRVCAKGNFLGALVGGDGADLFEG
ncbi:hypothetical protein BDV06DRAFT_158691 [Aspergillus oleicola]